MADSLLRSSPVCAALLGKGVELMRNIKIGQIAFFSYQFGFARSVLVFFSRILVQLGCTALASSATRSVVSVVQGLCISASNVLGAVALTVSGFKKLSCSFSFQHHLKSVVSVLVLALSSVRKVWSLNSVPFSNNKAQHKARFACRTRLRARPCARR